MEENKMRVRNGERGIHVSGTQKVIRVAVSCAYRPLYHTVSHHACSHCMLPARGPF